MRLTLNNGEWFWDVLKDQKDHYKYAGLASLLANIFAFGVSLFSMVVYDRILPNAATDSLISLLIGIVLILTLDYYVRQVRSQFLDIAGKNIDQIISEKLFKEIILKAVSTENNNSGTSASIVREFDNLKEFLASATITTFVDIPFSILFLLMIFSLSGALVIVPIISIIILLVIGVSSHRLMKHSSKTLQGLNHGKQSIMFECLNAKETINCLGKNDFFMDKWKAALEQQISHTLKSKSLSNRATNYVNLITQSNQIALISVGVLVTSLTGSLVAATLMAGRAIAPFSQVVNLLTRLSQAIESYKTISKVLAQDVKVTSHGVVDATALHGNIEFENISVTYPQGKTTSIDQVSLKIEKGDRVAILGKTGSGKTTLLRSLLGLVNISHGHIRIDGIDINDIDRNSLLSKFGVLLQETHLFNDTIAKNITLKSGLVDGESILKACQYSGFIDILKDLPDGLNTQIGESGKKLSGGQRRLLALTRMIYEEKSHIIMDEPTSGLDPTTENQVLDSLLPLLQDKTVIFVTHRPAPLKLSTKIAIIDKGKLIAFGPRDQILASLQRNANQT